MIDVAIVMAKNEGKIIGRCVALARRYAERVIVYDTGSGDDTVQAAESAGATALPQEWLGFGDTRTACYERTRAAYMAGAYGELKDPWILTLDADAYMTGPEIVPPDPVDGAAQAVTFTIRWESGSRETWRRPHLFRGPWRWVGPVHEFPAADGGRAVMAEAPPGNVYVECLDGARRNADSEETRRRLAREAYMLEGAVSANLGGQRGRWLFYLAQTVDLLGRSSAWERYAERALRAGPSDSAQETYVAAWRAIGRGAADADSGMTADDVERLIEACRKVSPSRAEAHVDAAAYMATRNPARAAQLAGYAVAIVRDRLAVVAASGGNMAPDLLFVDRSYYPRKTLEVAERIASPQVVHLAAELLALRSEMGPKVP